LAWKIEFKESAKKQLLKLDRQWQKTILDYLDSIALLENPQIKGKSLKGDKKGFWRYRVENYRILCHIQESDKIIIILVVGHRKNIYEV
jgi:mRNA interferase RelE/StbE